MSKICSVCGCTCNDDAKFCESCGNAFTASSSQTGYQNTNNYSNQNNSYQNPYQQNNNFTGYNNPDFTNNQGYNSFNYQNSQNTNQGNFRFAYGNPNGMPYPVKRTNKGLVVTICIIVALLLITGIVVPIVIAVSGRTLSSSEKEEFFREGIMEADKGDAYDSYYVAPGESFSLTDYDTISGMEFYSSDTSILTVSSSGEVTGVSKGTAYVLWYYSDADDDHGVVKIEVDKEYSGWNDKYSSFSGQEMYDS